MNPLRIPASKVLTCLTHFLRHSATHPECRAIAWNNPLGTTPIDKLYCVATSSTPSCLQLMYFYRLINAACHMETSSETRVQHVKNHCGDFTIYAQIDYKVGKVNENFLLRVQRSRVGF